MKGNIVQLSMEVFGCRVVQKALDTFKQDDEKIDSKQIIGLTRKFFGKLIILSLSPLEKLKPIFRNLLMPDNLKGRYSPKSTSFCLS